ncbi:MAG: hypothetical protein N2Z79_01565 [Candidatus Omnitrophica bacterium]|nr:hypothetical protein [Candidatus Omnitrophota bacterium]
MKKIHLLILGLIFVLGCTKKKEEILLRINSFTLTREEFEERLKEAGLNSSSSVEKEKFLEGLINQKLILLEAERQGLNQEKEFLRSLEDFYEKNLLKLILDRKAKEIATKVSVEEEEIRASYARAKDKGLTSKSYEEAYEQLRWQILKEKQNEEFSKWLEELRRKANIRIDKRLIR